MAISSLPTDTSSPFEHHQNIRLKHSSAERPPRLGNYTAATSTAIDLNDSFYNYMDLGTKGDQAISMATFGKEGLKPNEFDRGFKVALSSMMSNLGVNLLNFTVIRR